MKVFENTKGIHTLGLNHGAWEVTLIRKLNCLRSRLITVTELNAKFMETICMDSSHQPRARAGQKVGASLPVMTKVENVSESM